MNTRFDNRSAARYEFANGRKPRGEGNWWFTFDKFTEQGHESRAFQHYGLYSVAKREALAEAKAGGWETVSLES